MQGIRTAGSNDVRQSHESSPKAFTLLELLVVIGLVATLLALLIPAVQKAREAGARLECADHMRQLGLASHLYHDRHKFFPAGQRYSSNPKLMGMNYASWLYELLPMVDQEPLWRQVQTAYASAPTALHAPVQGQGKQIGLFACPVDAFAHQVQTVPNTQGPGSGLTSYVGVSGLDADTLNGVFFRNSWIPLSRITDGSSNTVMVGERPPVLWGTWWGKWYTDLGQNFAGSAGNLMGVRERNLMPITADGCPPGTYEFEQGTFGEPCDAFHFWSPHTGGANFLFADGSVRFLSFTANPILPALASRDGQEAVAIP